MLIALDICNIDIMQRFYNKSLRFIDAYCKGLGVKAAAYCVKKQKRYRVISKFAIQAFKDYIKA